MVILPDSGRLYDTGHGETRILVGTEQSAGGWWLGHFVSDPGRKTSLHVHNSADEQIYVLDGMLSVWLDGHWQELPTGALATAPVGVPHAIGNRSAKPVKFLVAGEPAGFEGFFNDLEVTARKYSYGSEEFLAALADVYKKYDSKLLGPPPEE